MGEEKRVKCLHAPTPDNRIFLFSARRCRLLAREFTRLPRLLLVNRENDARAHERERERKREYNF